MNKSYLSLALLCLTSMIATASESLWVEFKVWADRGVENDAPERYAEIITNHS